MKNLSQITTSYEEETFSITNTLTEQNIRNDCTPNRERQDDFHSEMSILKVFNFWDKHGIIRLKITDAPLS